MYEEESMLEPEYHPTFSAWKANPNPVNSGNLLKAIKPIIDTSVRTYVGTKPSPTIKSKAKLLALEGLERYEPGRAKLRTHLMSHMQGLRRMNQQEQQVINVPERIALHNFHLNKAEDELRDRLGRDPSTSELADHTGISPKRIGYIRKAKQGLAESQTNQLDEEGGQSTGPAVVDPELHSHIINFVYGDLHPTDQLILEHSLGLHGRAKRNKQWIGQKLKLSPGAISQRAAKIQQKIDDAAGAWPGGME